MKYTDEEFDALLKAALEQAVREEWAERLSESAAVSPDLDRRIKKLIKRTERKRKRHTHPIFMRIAHSAAMFVMALAILIGAAMLHPGARAYIVGVVRSWFSDHTEYEFVDQDTRSKPEDFVLGYIPDGFEMVDKYIIEEIGAYYTYENPDSIHFTVDIMVGAAKPHFDNENRNFYQIDIGGITVDIYESTGAKFASSAVMYLEPENVLIDVTGYIGIDEITEILKNIKPKV